jgi:hypothetical protein
MAKSFKLPPLHGQKEYILTKGQKLPIVRSALWGVVFCLDLGPFFFLFLFPCRVFFFYLFIYLFIDDIFPCTPRKDTTLYTRCSLGMAHSHVRPNSWFVLTTPCFGNANALVGLTHRDHGKQACHHKKVADGHIFHYLLCKASHIFTKRRPTKGIVHAPTIRLGK